MTNSEKKIEELMFLADEVNLIEYEHSFSSLKIHSLKKKNQLKCSQFKSKFKIKSRKFKTKFKI